MIEQPWREHAACKGMDVSLWYPETGEGTAGEAKAVCFECPVRAECLIEGMGERWGVWGGVTERDRRAIRRRRRRVAA